MGEKNISRGTIRNDVTKLISMKHIQEKKYMLCIFHEKKKPQQKNNIFVFFFMKKKYKPDPPLLDGILSIFKSNNVFFLLSIQLFKKRKRKYHKFGQDCD